MYNYLLDSVVEKTLLVVTFRQNKDIFHLTSYYTPSAKTKRECVITNETIIMKVNGHT